MNCLLSTHLTRFFFEGTRTGLALRYINRFSLNAPGNREDVPDIVTVITDGRAQDRVAIPARNIKRRKNTKVE